MPERVVRLQIKGLFELFFGTRPVPVVKPPDLRQGRMGLSERRVELQGPDRSFLLFGNGFLPRERASKTQLKEGLRNAGVGERVAQIFGDGFPGVVETSPRTFRGHLVVPVAASQVGVIRLRIDRASLNDQTVFFGTQ